MPQKNGKVIIKIEPDNANVLVRAAAFSTRVAAGHYEDVAKAITENRERMRQEPDNPRRPITTKTEDLETEKQAIKELKAASREELNTDEPHDMSAFREMRIADEIRNDIISLLSENAENTITYTTDREKAAVIMHITEFYSRVLCGQFGEIHLYTENLVTGKVLEEDGEEAFHQVFRTMMDRRERVEKPLRNARQILFPELHLQAHYGLGYSVETDLAFNIYMAVRHAVSWHDHPEGGWTVNFDPPWPVNGYETPVVTITD